MPAGMVAHGIGSVRGIGSPARSYLLFCVVLALALSLVYHGPRPKLMSCSCFPHYVTVFLTVLALAGYSICCSRRASPLIGAMRYRVDVIRQLSILFSLFLSSTFLQSPGISGSPALLPPFGVIDFLSRKPA